MILQRSQSFKDRSHPEITIAVIKLPNLISCLPLQKLFVCRPVPSLVPHFSSLPVFPQRVSAFRQLFIPFGKSGSAFCPFYRSTTRRSSKNADISRLIPGKASRRGRCRKTNRRETSSSRGRKTNSSEGGKQIVARIEKNPSQINKAGTNETNWPPLRYASLPG